MERKAIVKGVRELIGDRYYPDERRGAKTNELGMTRSQVIRLANEIADFVVKLGGREYENGQSV